MSIKKPVFIALKEKRTNTDNQLTIIWNEYN